ncbi:PD-(D/E)XK nuclease-like domain-containing protein [Thiococcus pfennigii]|uniref:PD-(D/E)XK nuclease-like domain-containing protein n=1 Tax=Thiococcus pfennigii TaxID=1057 RepID=UPI00190851CF|nr:PD-(D/E)XK nuclease-like domain-containing protein [Thiococcus pfennigii]MBK1699775.1 hypothetical protein [Thiococcus pfennigii]
MTELAEQKEVAWEPPAVLYDIPEADYRAYPAASSHALMTLLEESPRHVKEKPREATHALTLGTLAHLLLMQPELAERQVAVKPVGAGKGSNAAKQVLVDWLQEQTGIAPEIDGTLALGKQLDAAIAVLEPALAKSDKLVVDQAQLDAATRMRDSVLGRRLGEALFQDGHAEVMALARDLVSGVLCKIRVDWVPLAHQVLVDVKTTNSIGDADVARSAARYNYHIQAAFYQAIWQAATGEDRPFVFVFMESEPPYDCVFRPIERRSLDKGRRLYEYALRIWSMCEEANHWPGVGWDWNSMDYALQPLELPQWALR